MKSCASITPRRNDPELASPWNHGGMVAPPVILSPGETGAAGQWIESVTQPGERLPLRRHSFDVLLHRAWAALRAISLRFFGRQFQGASLAADEAGLAADLALLLSG